ncbi:MAG: amino acid dehydrogenase [Planctomycetes bacterium]|nr:amino acid dehydrogenase [Planctomycetota bacterium]
MKITELGISGYERVAHAQDPASGLVALIAVHDTTLGPAVGGMRMWNYATESDALTDVLRLAEGMTYKSAVANTGLGGGKSVILGNARSAKTPALLEAMGRFIESFDGRYYGAEDVGICTADVEVVSKGTKWVTGLPRHLGGSGDPSPFTAWGVFLGLKAALAERFGTDEVRGRTVAIQGLGSVGMAVAQHLHAHGAKLMVTDIHEAVVQKAVAAFGARSVEPERIFDVPADVFAPCALGGVLNDSTLARLKCAVIAGAANNQLHEPRHGRVLMDKGLVYAPDFVINAGGVVNISAEFHAGGYDENVAREKVGNIGAAVASVLRLARERGIPSSEAALQLAQDRLAAGKADPKPH